MANNTSVFERMSVDSKVRAVVVFCLHSGALQHVHDLSIRGCQQRQERKKKVDEKEGLKNGLTVSYVFLPPPARTHTHSPPLMSTTLLTVGGRPGKDSSPYQGDALAFSGAPTPTCAHHCTATQNIDGFVRRMVDDVYTREAKKYYRGQYEKQRCLFCVCEAASCQALIRIYFEHF